jgi:rhodanese-related sulfurtransferase
MVARGFGQLVVEANAVVETIRAEDAVRLVNDPSAVFVDVREAAERKVTGAVNGAVSAPRGLLELHADPASSLHLKEFSSGKRLVLYCGLGGCSALAADRALRRSSKACLDASQGAVLDVLRPPTICDGDAARWQTWTEWWSGQTEVT